MVTISNKTRVESIKRAIRRTSKPTVYFDPEQGIQSRAEPPTAKEILKVPTPGGGSGGSVQSTPTFKTPTATRPTSTTTIPIKPELAKVQKPQGTVTAFKRPKGVLESRAQIIAEQRRILREQRIREQYKRRKAPLKQRIKREAVLGGLTALTVGIETGVGIKQLPGTVVKITKNPKVLLKIPSILKQDAENFGRLLKTSPTEAVARVGTEIVLLKGSSKALKKLGNISEVTTAKLSPKYVGKAQTGKTLKIKVKDKTINLKVVGKIPKQKLSEQVKLAGKKVTAISTQADALLGIVRRKKLIRKPIPGEDKFSKGLKEKLKKFDEGKLSKKDTLKLDAQIRKTKAKGLLEREFFADPRARVRPSRLGIKPALSKKLKDIKRRLALKKRVTHEEKKALRKAESGEADFLDLLFDDVKFRKSKPQILLFEQAKIQKLPKSLKTIEKKLSKNQPLTQAETNKLLEFQLKKSGKFKPVGFISKESEITLAPGEVIKRVKKVGVTIADGRKVPIVKVKVVKTKGEVKKLLAKADKGKASKKELKKLDKLLTKKTGFKSKLSSSPKTSKKRVPVKRLGSSALSRIVKSRRRRPLKVSRVSPRKRKAPTSRKVGKPSPRPKPSPRGRPSPGTPKLTTSPTKKIPPTKKPPIIRPPGRPPTTTKSPPTIVKAKRKPRRKKRKPTQRIGYNVFGKQGGKFIKLNTLPLSKKDALNRGAYAIDHTTSRTLKIKPVGKKKKLGKLNPFENKYFSKTKNKYRGVKIRKGKRKFVQNKFIEKLGRPVIDTRGEKRGLKLNKLAKQLRSPTIKRRRKSTSKRKKR